MDKLNRGRPSSLSLLSSPTTNRRRGVSPFTEVQYGHHVHVPQFDNKKVAQGISAQTSKDVVFCDKWQVHFRRKS